MIEVIKQKEDKIIVCEGCGSELRYHDEDVHDVYCGSGFTCPVCGEDVIVDYHDVDPVFPNTFYQFGSSNNAVHIDDKETQAMVDIVYKELKELNVGDFKFMATGDTLVIGSNFEDETNIWVAKNYYEWEEYKED